jgi:hypothetical protein
MILWNQTTATKLGEQLKGFEGSAGETNTEQTLVIKRGTIEGAGSMR